jgi:hypothetical protein
VHSVLTGVGALRADAVVHWVLTRVGALGALFTKVRFGLWSLSDLHHALLLQGHTNEIPEVEAGCIARGSRRMWKSRVQERHTDARQPEHRR